jgi:hypothetical protein
MTLPASRYYTADDLSWFSLDRYTSLNDFSFSQWRNLVRDRLHAQHVVEAALNQSSELVPSGLQQRWGLSTDELTEGDAELLQELATRIKESPLENLDARMTLTGTERPAATSTVRLMTGRYLQNLSGRVRDEDVIGSDMEVDGFLLAERSEFKSTERHPGRYRCPLRHAYGVRFSPPRL